MSAQATLERPVLTPPAPIAPARRRGGVPAPKRPQQPRELSAKEVTFGVWTLSLESRSEPGTAHELTVSHGQAGPCDCTAATFSVECHHRKDAAILAPALDEIAASLACIREERAHWQGSVSADRVLGWRTEIDFSLGVVEALGYKVIKIRGVL